MLKMFKQIPGQARSCDVWLALLLGVAAYLTTKNLLTAVGAAMIPIGCFLAAQATHLAQVEHANEGPTWIEGQMKKKFGRFLFLGIGAAIMLIGLLLVIL